MFSESGFPCSWKVLDFLVQFPGPEKSWKFECKVLESPGIFQAMIMMWEADKMTQVQMLKFASSHISSSDCSFKRILVTARLYCIIHPALKCTVSWKVLEIFLTKTVGTLLNAFVSGLLSMKHLQVFSSSCHL